MSAFERPIRPVPIDPAERSTDARLARLHLRTGAFGLARAELETLAGAGALDDLALLDLAEVRWRTGDLTGAGEAAQAYLAAGGEGPLGFVIAAEAAAARGRPGEAKRLATRALERAGTSLDRLFAGIQRSGAWPTDPTDPGEPAGALFPVADDPSDRRRRAAGPGSPPAVARALPGSAATAAPNVPAAASSAAPQPGPGLWDDAATPDADGPRPPDPGGLLDAARRALDAGEEDAAVVHLGIALRLDPSLASSVLAVVGTRPGAGLDLVRGDAHRAAGRDAEAGHFYAAAAATLAAAERTRAVTGEPFSSGELSAEGEMSARRPASQRPAPPP